MILIYRYSETIPTVIGKFLAATCCSYLQQPSLSPSPQLYKSQVPSPGGREAVVAVVPLVPAGAAPAALSFMLPHRGTRLSVVRHSAADRSSGSSTLEADWLQLRAASVKIDLQQPRSEVNLYVKL